MTNYRIEYRAEIPILLSDGEGCRPASDAEEYFWKITRNRRAQVMGLLRSCQQQSKRIHELEAQITKLQATVKEQAEIISGKTFYDIDAVARKEERQAIVDYIDELGINSSQPVVGIILAQVASWISKRDQPCKE